MTPEEWAEQTATAQGLPPKITDPVVLRRIAILMVGGRRAVAADRADLDARRGAPRRDRAG